MQLFSAALAVALALCAAPVAAVTCGTTSYSKQQIDSAVAEAGRLIAAGKQVGSNKYPHRFNNFEGLKFAATGPTQEFPLLSKGVYRGKAPGPDRVVFNLSSQAAFVGAMTHTGAPTRNGFVLCSDP